MLSMTAKKRSFMQMVQVHKQAWWSTCLYLCTAFFYFWDQSCQDHPFRTKLQWTVCSSSNQRWQCLSRQTSAMMAKVWYSYMMAISHDNILLVNYHSSAGHLTVPLANARGWSCLLLMLMIWGTRRRHLLLNLNLRRWWRSTLREMGLPRSHVGPSSTLSSSTLLLPRDAYILWGYLFINIQGLHPEWHSHPRLSHLQVPMPNRHFHLESHYHNGHGCIPNTNECMHNAFMMILASSVHDGIKSLVASN